MAKRRERYEAFAEWFIPDEQKAIIQIARDMVHEIFLSNESRKYENITNMIMQEQVLIKGWRKSDNKIRKSILNREKESVTA